MARRVIPDLEEKILTEAINLGARYGAKKVSTTELAQNIGITEPTIYAHFKTKMDLLLSSYYFSSRGFEAFLRRVDWESIHVLEDYERVWSDILDYAVAHPAEAKYYVSFRTSVNYDTTTNCGYEDYFIMLAKKGLSLDPDNKELTDSEYHDLWVHWVDLTFKFAELMIDGFIPNNAKTKSLLIQLIFGEHISSVYKNVN